MRGKSPTYRIPALKISRSATAMGRRPAKAKLGRLPASRRLAAHRSGKAFGSVALQKQYRLSKQFSLSKPTEITNEPSAVPTLLPVCPVCGRYCEGDLHPIDALPESLQPIVRSNASTAEAVRICGRCIEIFTRAQRQIESQGLPSVAAPDGARRIGSSAGRFRVSDHVETARFHAGAGPAQPGTA